jgi:co-chaperonin GroES (HSP10)
METVSPYSTGFKPDLHTSLEWYFPEVDPGCLPLGPRILVQLRRVKTKSSGGIQLLGSSKDAEAWNTTVGKVIEIGPLAYRRRDNGETWPEGNWLKRGDFVKVPRWGGDRWSIEVPDSDEPVPFVILMDNEAFAKVTADPRTVRAFIL